MREKSPRGMGRHLRQTLLTGLVVLLPLLITVWLLVALFGLVNGATTPWVRRLLLLTGLPLFSHPAFFNYGAPVVGFLVTILLIYLAGILSTNLFGVRLLAALDRLMLRIPIVRAVYGGSKQLMDALSPRGTRTFTQVVMVEYPRRGTYTLGFVTRLDLPAVASSAGTAEMAAVFLPTTPNPTSGWMLLLPRQELIPLPLTVEEGVKLIVSGGIVVPDRWEGQSGAYAGAPEPVPR